MRISDWRSDVCSSDLNQGVQFPIARAHINVEAASLMRYEACRLFDAHQPCGAQANMAKLLAADASWEAANACLQFHGGFGFATEYAVERKFRETRPYQMAQIGRASGRERGCQYVKI